MRVELNGAAADLPAGVAVRDVVVRMGRDPDQPGLAVAVNGHVVRRTEWAATMLHDGDRVEVVTAVQGGAQ